MLGYILTAIGGAVGVFLVGHPKGHRITGAALGPVVALLSNILGSKSAADGGKKKPCKLATCKTTSTPTGPEPSTSELQGMLDSLNSLGKKNLEALDDAGRGYLLRKCVDSIMAAGDGLVAETLKYKGSYEPGHGEETLVWGATSSLACSMAQSFESLANGRDAQPVSVDEHVSGRKIVTVFPQGFYECGLFGGYNGELWFEPGVEPERERPQKEKARLFHLLGAGNQATVVGCDALNIIFREHAVCICKLNPVNDYLKPHLEKAFAPLIDAGLLVFVNGGREVSDFLINHELVQALHLTGSDKTYDAIMWGPGSKKEGKPKLDKTFSAELGACTPFILTPGEWSDAAIELHARQTVAAAVHNGHFNCVSAQLLVTDKKWKQRQQYLDAFTRHLKAAQPRSAYYPGAETRCQQFVDAYKDKVMHVGQKADGCVPWTFIVGAEAVPDGHACCNEAWAGVITEVPLETDGSPTAFLEAATRFCNEKVWGTLSCSIFIPPDTQESCSAACEKAITDLKYGSVNVNIPSIMGYFVMKCTWGGYKGHTPQDIQSGIGNIHNSLMYKNVEKSVIRGPWLQNIVPFWCHDHSNLENLAPWICRQLAGESLVNWTMCAIHAVQG